MRRSRVPQDAANTDTTRPSVTICRADYVSGSRDRPRGSNSFVRADSHTPTTSGSRDSRRQSRTEFRPADAPSTMSDGVVEARAQEPSLPLAADRRAAASSPGSRRDPCRSRQAARSRRRVVFQRTVSLPRACAQTDVVLQPGRARLDPMRKAGAANRSRTLRASRSDAAVEADRDVRFAGHTDAREPLQRNTRSPWNGCSSTLIRVPMTRGRRRTPLQMLRSRDRDHLRRRGSSRTSALVSRRPANGRRPAQCRSCRHRPDVASRERAVRFDAEDAVAHSPRPTRTRIAATSIVRTPGTPAGLPCYWAGWSRPRRTDPASALATAAARRR